MEFLMPTPEKRMVQETNPFSLALGSGPACVSEAVGENKRFSKLETSIKELMERTSSLEQKVGYMEERVGNTEDNTMRMEQAVAVLLRETTKLSKKCDDLEARMRRNNIRIHGIPEGAEKDSTISFIT
ncbi:hypothetical protein GOODEAATRI_026497 [Goodea atripinnis]|uniref:Uncharacterized protein n=1 Tax=Goodea atripinnis TaxID=208336 RepID=A0ABV0PRV0_9TELE